MRETKSIIKYRFWSFISKMALKAYYLSPRELMQNEILLIHRMAMKRAHSARMKGADNDERT